MKKISLLLLLCLCSMTLWAVPAKRITFTVEQPDGTVLTLTQRGDEFFHYLMTEDGLVVKANDKAFYYAEIKEGYIVPSKHLAHSLSLRSEEEQRIVEKLPPVQQFCDIALQHGQTAQRVRATRAAQKVAEVPATGEVRVPVILVQYADVKFSTDNPQATFEGHINGDDYKAEGGYGSVKEYFEDQSMGKFIPKFDIIGPVTLPSKMEYYGGNDEQGSDKNPRLMVKEACKKAEADFSQYDNNGDGYVDIVYIIYAGYGENANMDQLENTIWPHQWQLAEPLTLDGVKISKYACNNELSGWRGSTIDGIGIFCHEFSHCLGLPDFYPTGDDQSPFGMESWSLMHYGSYSNNGRTPCGYTGYELDFLGWRELIVLDKPQDITLTALSEGGCAYKIVNDANPDEYYVVESHKKSKWDAYAPAEGMLVLHVDYLESAWMYNTVNNNFSHQRMTIIPADNKATRQTQAGDTYPGTTNNTALTQTSTPAATVFTGGYMGKDITDISMRNGVVTFSFMKGALGVPVLNGPHDVTGSGFSVSWDKIAGVEDYEVELSILEPMPYMLYEDFDKVKKDESNTDIGDTLDDYTNQKGWRGVEVYGLDGAVRVGSKTARGAITTPFLHTDSTHITVIYTVRKSSPTDNNAGMVLCITDTDWVDDSGNQELYGYIFTLGNSEWATYYTVIDKIGNNSYIYIDTRDYDGSSVKEATRVDIDGIQVFEGDISAKLEGNGAPKRANQIPVQYNLPAHAPKKASSNNMLSLYKASEEENTEEQQQNGLYRIRTVLTRQTTENSFRFENLDGGSYRCTVRSIRDGIYSRRSNSVDVQIVDSLLPPIPAVPYVYFDNDCVYMGTDDPEVTLHYTLDGTTPTGYSTRYEGPIALKEKTTIQFVARKSGYRRSEVYEERNWFNSQHATYRISSTVDPKVALSANIKGNSKDDYVGHYVVPAEVEYESLRYKVAGIDDQTFCNATSLRSVEIGNKELKTIGDSLFRGCTALKAVIWDVDQPLSATMFDEQSYYNLLVYTPAEAEFSHPLIDAGRMALVCNGVCENLILNGGVPFYCPRPFTAETVTYQRSFMQTTGLGSAGGWETIVLPFDVQHFIHSAKGEIAPFGNSAEHNFWLSELGEKGFKRATKLLANIPYIIAMPNNPKYGENSMSGIVTFFANQSLVHATKELEASEGAAFNFVPTYEPVAQHEDVYVLNVGADYGKYVPGSVFAPNEYVASPFTAYVAPSEGQARAPYFLIQAEPETEKEITVFSVTSKEGIVYIHTPEPKTVTIYDMMGRKVRQIFCNAGVNELAELQNGIYFVENVKICVRY